jgi:hypothetical protein
MEMKIPQNILVFLSIFLINCSDKGPEPADFDISKIEGTYSTSIVIAPWWTSDLPRLEYDGSCLVSLIDSERFIMTFNFGNEYSFPSITGIIKGKTIGYIDVKIGGVYFEIEEADTLKGQDTGGGIGIQTKDGSRKIAYGVIQEFGPNTEKLWLVLNLRNKQDESTRYNFQGTKN